MEMEQDASRNNTTQVEALGTYLLVLLLLTKKLLIKKYSLRRDALRNTFRRVRKTIHWTLTTKLKVDVRDRRYVPVWALRPLPDTEYSNQTAPPRRPYRSERRLTGTGEKPRRALLQSRTEKDGRRAGRRGCAVTSTDQGCQVYGFIRTYTDIWNFQKTCTDFHLCTDRYIRKLGPFAIVDRTDECY